MEEMKRIFHFEFRAGLVFALVAFMSVTFVSQARVGGLEGVEWSGDSILCIDWSVTEIPERAFEDSHGLRKVVFRKGPRGETPRLRVIGEYAFSLCASLESVDLPDSLTFLPKGIFYGCSALEHAGLPSRLEELGAHAFAYCSSLKNIEIPLSVRGIGNNAFSRCASLERIVIPDSVSLLESYAFSDCFSMTEAILPANPSLLGELIFSGCEALRLLKEPSVIPPEFDCMSFIFEPDEERLYEQVVLEVPSGSVISYRNAHGWSLFHSVVPVR